MFTLATFSAKTTAVEPAIGRALLALATFGDIAQIETIVFEVHYLKQGCLTQREASVRYYSKGSLSKVLTSLDKPHLVLKLLFTYFSK